MVTLQETGVFFFFLSFLVPLFFFSFLSFIALFGFGHGLGFGLD